jgi:SAM-dependent methyltransferase
VTGADAGRPEFADHFSQVAASYAASRPTYPREFVTWLATVAAARDLAWDVGCGSGQMSTLLADAFARVIGTDASARQLEQARPHARIEYRVARAEASGIEARSVDVVVVAQAAHWFDLEAFYAEVRRVAKPGASIVLVSYGDVVVEGEAGVVLERFYSGTLRGYWPPEREHINAGYRTLAFPFDEIVAPPFAMRARWTLDRLLGYAETWSGMLAFRKVDPATADAMRADVARAWGDPRVEREVTWPFILRVGSVFRSDTR